MLIIGLLSARAVLQPFTAQPGAHTACAADLQWLLTALGGTHLRKFKSTVCCPQLATIQRSAESLALAGSVTHVNLAHFRATWPVSTLSSGFRRSRRSLSILLLPGFLKASWVTPE
jgi:hypothetical protein